MVSARRDDTTKPDQVVAALGLAPGQVVADVGSGPGYFTLRFARVVGPAGQVYGVDVEPHFLAELRRLAAASGLANVVPVLAVPDDPGLPSACCDLAFFCSAYRHIDDRVGYLRRLRTRLKPGGRVAIMEWKRIADLAEARRSATRVGPAEEEKIEREQVVRELGEAGFKVLESPDFLEYHYLLIAGVRAEETSREE